MPSLPSKMKKISKRFLKKIIELSRRTLFYIKLEFVSSILWMVVVVTMNKPSRVFQVFVSPKELCQLNEKHFLQPFEATSCAFYILLSLELELCYPFSWHYDIYPGKNIWFISIYQKTSSFTMLINIQIYKHRIF